jgi:hypothetical protein
MNGSIINKCENIVRGATVIALDAYHNKPALVIDGLTADQRFFLSYAQGWREKSTDDSKLPSRVQDREQMVTRRWVLRAAAAAAADLRMNFDARALAMRAPECGMKLAAAAVRECRPIPHRRRRCRPICRSMCPARLQQEDSWKLLDRL